MRGWMPDAGVARFPVFHRFIRQAARIAQRGDAIGQEGAALLLAEIALAMAVILDQAGHGGKVGRLDGIGAAGHVRRRRS